LSFAEPVQDIIKKLENANIYEVDWDRNGEIYEANSTNKYRDVKIKLSNTKALAKIELKDDANFQIFALITCYRLADLIPIERASTWSDAQGEEEAALNRVFSKDIQVGQTNSEDIKGWNASFTRTQEGAHCSVKKL
jgi:hypothetical protein